MRKIVAVLIAMGLAIGLESPAHAAKAVQFSFNNIMNASGQVDRQVDEQTWWLDSATPDPNHAVTNPLLPCTWDINDHSTAIAQSGYLPPGQSSSTGLCHVFDYNPILQCTGGICNVYTFRKNYAGLNVTATAPGLTVTVCFQPQDFCASPQPIATPIRHGTTYSWMFCGQAVYNALDPALQLIPNSGFGGYGVQTTVTMTVTNSSSAKVTNISAGWGLSSDVFFPPGCSSSDPTLGPNPQYAYPMAWSTS